MSILIFKYPKLPNHTFRIILLLIYSLTACQKEETSQAVIKDEPIFIGDFETGDTSQWGDVNRNLKRPLSDQLEIVTSPVREGIYAAKTTVHNGDEFLNTGGERCDFERDIAIPFEKEGADLWYAWSTLFPSGWQKLPIIPEENWLLIADWHSTYDDIGQLLQLEIDSDNYIWARGLTGKVNGYNGFQGNGDANYIEQKFPQRMIPGEWNDFVIHVKWTTKKEGLITIWHKTESQVQFTRVLQLNKIPTLQYLTTANNYKAPYFILAHYRTSANTHTSVIYHDGFRIGKTKEAVQVGDLYMIKE